MRLHHTYLAARERAGGKVQILAEAWHLASAGDVATVSEAHERLQLAPDTARKYSHALFVFENRVRASYEFPDPVEAEHAQQQQEIRALRERILAAGQVQAAADQAAALASTAAADAAAAEQELAKLTGQPATESSEEPPAFVLPPVPTMAEVLAAGYPAHTVPSIIARAQAGHDAAKLVLDAGGSLEEAQLAAQAADLAHSRAQAIVDAGGTTAQAHAAAEAGPDTANNSTAAGGAHATEPPAGETPEPSGGNGSGTPPEAAPADAEPKPEAAPAPEPKPDAAPTVASAAAAAAAAIAAKRGKPRTP